MSNIAKAFENGKAFVPFITCGDPDLDTTARCVVEMQKAGASLIELGIPFSDPMAEGPVIMEASLRALENGCTTDKVFEMVKRLRTELNVTVPMVFMTYANVVFSYGIERFCKKASEYGIDLISLIAPTSDERISMVASSATGFIYIVSSLGVTGVRSQITTDIPSLCAAVKAATDVPCAIGFGISTPEQAAKMAASADGVIVGSAIVKIVARYGKDAPEHVGEYVKSMVDAIR